MNTVSQACKPYYCALTALSSVGIFHADSEGHYLSVNERWCEIGGITAAEAQGEGWAQALHPDDRERGLAEWYRVVQENLLFQSEYRLQRSDGKITWVLAQAIAEKNDTGAVTGYVGIITDITECRRTEKKLTKYRHRLEELVEERTTELRRTNEQLQQEIADRKCMEEVLRESQERLQLFIDHAPAAVAMFDRQMCYIGMSRRWLTDFNLEEQAIIGRCHYDVWSDIPERWKETHQRCLNGAVERCESDRFDRANGDKTWIRWEVRPWHDRDGEIGGIVVFSEDITKRKIAEEALRQQFLREQLEATIAQRIHQSLNLEEILNTTVVEARKFLATDRVIIYRFQPDGSGIVAVESVGADWIPISGTIIHDCCFAQTYTQLYRQGRVQAIEDIYTAGLTPCHVDLLAQFQIKANLVVPIVQEEELWGLLVAQECSGTRQWQSLEIDLLKFLATQAAIAIQKSELYEQAQAEIAQRQQAETALRQQFLREQLVGAIARRIRQSLNLEEILNTTVTEVRQFLVCDRAIMFRFEPDWSGIVAVESVDEGWTPILGTNIHDSCFEVSHVQLYKEGRVKAIPDIYTSQLSQCHIDLLAQFQVRANLVVPILVGEQLWGLLIAHDCSEPRQWQQFEIDLLKQLATQVAIAIQQSQLYKQTQHQVHREQALNRVIQTIRNSLDLTTIFSTAVSEIAQLLETDRADIMQYLPEMKVWRLVANYPQTSDLSNTVTVEVSDEGNEVAAQLKRLEIVRIEDISTGVNDEINRDLAQTHPGTWLLVPLHFGASVWGSLSLVRNSRPSSWQHSEVELTCAVANQLAIALQQAELYQQSCSATAKAITQAEQIEQALQELQKTQAHLVQSEKMSSLGQLVAGVAHEINNPVNFIYANLTYASNYTQDLLGLIQLYQQQYPNPTPEISSAIEAIELDFLVEDLLKLLDSMKVGAERICDIVSALRNFSRLAEAEIKAVDIHKGIDSTLTILQNRLKAHGKHPEIRVVREYGNLPKVECYAGQLNQVFMNLFSNAIDAIDEQNQTRTPEEIQANPSLIRVHTEVLNEQFVVIRIADNGPGITAQVKARIFDPFFTTKPVGAGTGLGLSISYQIVVEKHGGQLHCFSELGQGTEFVIQIPLLDISRTLYAKT